MYVFFYVSFVVGRKKNFSKCLQFTDESMFNFDVVLSTMSDSTFGMILITKA